MVQAPLEIKHIPFNTSPAHEVLIGRAKTWLAGSQRCAVVASDYGAGSERPDVIGWPYLGGSILVEVKVNRADFLADRRKEVRRSPRTGMGCRRWYLAPPGLITVSELPKSWGLLEPIGQKGGLKQIVKALRHTEWNLFAEQRLLMNVAADWRLVANAWAREMDRNGINPPDVLGWPSDRPVNSRLG